VKGLNISIHWKKLCSTPLLHYWHLSETYPFKNIDSKLTNQQSSIIRMADSRMRTTNRKRLSVIV